MRLPPVSTFSIVARADNGDLGIAVASKFLAVGAVVPWARAGVGAVATQAFANTAFGPHGLQMLESGASAQQVVDTLIADDDKREERQFGLVSAAGEAAAHTGSDCMTWAGHRTAEGVTAQGNILRGPEVVDALIDTYLKSRKPLPQRLMEALAAGDAAGGDRRGRQSAALLVVRTGAGYGGHNDRFIDLRVDDHDHPIPELERMLHIHLLYFTRPEPQDLLPLTPDLVQQVQEGLRRLGHYGGDLHGRFDDATRDALRHFEHMENFELRQTAGAQIDQHVFSFLQFKAKL